MNPPFISVIIPVYKLSKDFDECIKSIYNQSFKEFEILIVQRISEIDSKIEILKNSNDLPIKLIKTKKSGIYTAMNLGIKQAIGEWILFLGQDDQLASISVFTSIFDKLKNINQGIALGNVEVINRKNWLIPSRYKNKLTFLSHLKNTVHHQGILYHSSIFAQNKFDDNLSILADYKLNLMLYKAKIQITYLEIFVSRCGGSGVSKNFTKQLYNEEKQLKKDLYPLPLFLILNLFIYLKRTIKTSLIN